MYGRPTKPIILPMDSGMLLNCYNKHRSSIFRTTLMIPATLRTIKVPGFLACSQGHIAHVNSLANPNQRLRIIPHLILNGLEYINLKPTPGPSYSYPQTSDYRYHPYTLPQSYYHPPFQLSHGACSVMTDSRNFTHHPPPPPQM